MNSAQLTRRLACLFAIATFTIFGQSRLDHKFMEYGIIDYSDGKTTGQQKPFPKGEIYFAQKEYDDFSQMFYKVKHGYNKIIYVIINSKQKADQKVRLKFKTDEKLILGLHGPGGDETFTVPGNKTVRFPVKVFSQDVNHGIYDFTASIVDEQGKILDRLPGKIFIAAPEIQITAKLQKRAGALNVYELHNQGEALHNLTVKLKGAEGYRMSPEVNHYLFGKDKKLTVSVFPTGASQAGAKPGLELISAGRTKTLPIDLALPAGQKIQLISLDPAIRLRKKDYYCVNRPIIHFQYQIPYARLREVKPSEATGSIEWLTAKIKRVRTQGKGIDTVNNGKKDHWELVENGTLVMTADDFDRDGKIDFFRETDSGERTLNRGYIKIKGKWYETNIMSMYLVSKFLPLSDVARMRPHDVKVLFNDKLISSRKKIIPTGASIYRMRPDLLAGIENGTSTNKVTISTEHVPGPAYQVTSENTLVVHYSSIQFPVATKSDLKLDTTEIDQLIRAKETEIEQEASAAKKKLLGNVLSNLKKDRDRILKKASEFVKVGDLHFSGIKDRGHDLGIYSNESAIKGSKFTGWVRNMGYEAAAYQVTVHRHSQGKSKKVTSKKYPKLPPFARRPIELALPGHSNSRRNIYKVSIELLGVREKELIISNNNSYTITGPPPTGDSLRAEMRHLANEMGVTEDEVTLTRPPTQIAVDNFTTRYARAFKTSKVEFSTPIANVDKSTRVFLLEDL